MHAVTAIERELLLRTSLAERCYMQSRIPVYRIPEKEACKMDPWPFIQDQDEYAGCVLPANNKEKERYVFRNRFSHAYLLRGDFVPLRTSTPTNSTDLPSKCTSVRPGALRSRRNRLIGAPGAENVPKADKTAASGSKRRVKIRRKSAAPGIDPAVAYAIGQAIESLELNALKDLVVAHDAQMHALRIILFDLMIIFREEHYNARDAVTKNRFARHIDKIRATLEANVPEFRGYHGNANDIDDLDAATGDYEDFGLDIEELVRQRGDDGPDTEEEDMDLIDEMLERASEEVEAPEWTLPEAPRRHPRTASRQPARRRRR
jgi:hypothetical protein